MASKSDDDLLWIVHQRYEIQKTLLDLYSSLQTSNLSERATTLLALLSGAAFSLWRAVFLVGQERSTEKLVPKLTVFLEKVIKDNAIGYPQDKEASPWTVGYYLASSNYRLIDATERLNANEVTSELQAAIARLASDGGATVAQTKLEWENSHDALRLIYSNLNLVD